MPRVRTIIEYEEVEKIKKVPVERKVTDYRAVEYITEYVPKVTTEKEIEYIPREKNVPKVTYEPYTYKKEHLPAE